MTALARNTHGNRELYASRIPRHLKTAYVPSGVQFLQSHQAIRTNFRHNNYVQFLLDMKRILTHIEYWILDQTKS